MKAKLPPTVFKKLNADIESFARDICETRGMEFWNYWEITNTVTRNGWLTKAYQETVQFIKENSIPIPDGQSYQSFVGELVHVLSKNRQKDKPKQGDGDTDASASAAGGDVGTAFAPGSTCSSPDQDPEEPEYPSPRL
ncbi:MAG TPA: hypothetical protein VKF36_05890 [Syntrophorhabdales bacterium]|nr:hypothetical protein [Syntrophorhabdales bacterium]